MLYIDKYIPRKIEDLIYNIDVGKKLMDLAKKDTPHLIISGSGGSGKKTFAKLFIGFKYDKPINLKTQIYELKRGSKSKNIEINVKHSKYHSQLNPSLSGVYDRFLIQEFIMDIIKTKPLGNIPYYTIVIEDAEKLTIDAQQCLRRTLETHIDMCRFIFLTNSNTSLIEPLVSRCIKISIPTPTSDELLNLLSGICLKEQITAKDDRLIEIIKNSNRNTRLTLNTLQLIFETNKDLLIADNVIDFNLTSSKCLYITNIVEELRVNNIDVVRNLLYDLLLHCIDPLDILKDIYYKIIDTYPITKDSFFKLTEFLAYYENTYKQGSKPIYHLEGFCISIMDTQTFSLS